MILDFGFLSDPSQNFRKLSCHPGAFATKVWWPACKSVVGRAPVDVELEITRGLLRSPPPVNELFAGRPADDLLAAVVKTREESSSVGRYEGKMRLAKSLFQSIFQHRTVPGRQNPPEVIPPGRRRFYARQADFCFRENGTQKRRAHVLDESREECGLLFRDSAFWLHG